MNNCPICYEHYYDMYDDCPSCGYPYRNVKHQRLFRSGLKRETPVNIRSKYYKSGAEWREIWDKMDVNKVIRDYVFEYYKDKDIDADLLNTLAGRMIELASIPEFAAECVIQESLCVKLFWDVDLFFSVQRYLESVKDL